MAPGGSAQNTNSAQTPNSNTNEDDIWEDGNANANGAVDNNANDNGHQDPNENGGDNIGEPNNEVVENPTPVTFSPLVSYEAGGIPVSIAVADLDHDTDFDLAVANYPFLFVDPVEGQENPVSVLRYSGSRTFAPATVYLIEFVDFPPVSVAVEDFDGDNDQDLVVTSPNVGSDTALLLINDGTGTIVGEIPLDLGDAEGPSYVCAGDLNLDGKPDVVTANRESDNISVLLNNGVGSFSGSVEYRVGPIPSGSTGGEGPSSVTLLDLDGDGDLDVATGNQFSDTISVLLNDGWGGFTTPVQFASGGFPSSVRWGDFDRDGDPDLAVANPMVDMVSIVFNDGGAGFGGLVQYETGSRPSSIAIVDLNGDSNLDLIVADSWGDTVSVLLGQEDGTFAPRVAFSCGENPVFVVAEDFDGDGRPDLAVANRMAQAVSVLFNETPFSK